MDVEDFDKPFYELSQQDQITRLLWRIQSLEQKVTGLKVGQDVVGGVAVDAWRLASEDGKIPAPGPWPT
jgi:hypothetical protein